MQNAADRINYLNIALMIVSCAVAYVVPFELFLFSYAVLGPLHYLTEISWLHDRGYFIRRPAPAPAPARRSGKRAAPKNVAETSAVRRFGAEHGWLLLVGITLVVMLAGLLAEKALHLKLSPVWEIGLFYLVFVSAALFMVARSAVRAAVVIALAGIAVLLFNGSPYYGLVAFFLITIVHVFLFTAAFILYGALKAKSRSGVLSLVVFALCAVSFFIVVPEIAGSGASGYVRSSYASFQTLNVQLIKLFHLGPGTSLTEIYESSAGLVVMRLIAFAYTYHYLNWFSKTSIIRWHDVSKGRAAAIAALWLGSLALYARSYELGFIALYFLSVLHVMLEFPLNHQSFIGIGRELYGLARPVRRTASART